MENTNRNFTIAIYPKDVAIITRKSLKSANRLTLKIRKDLGKEPHQILTVSEFCKYMGLEPLDIMGSLNL
jgi:hypothetical protein